jgi:VanZ family protein
MPRVPRSRADAGVPCSKGRPVPKPKMDSAARFAKLAVAWALVIFVLSSIPGAAFPHSKLLSYDKLLHAGVYAVLGAFCFMALPRSWSSKASVLVLVSGAISTLYGFTDEFHQLFVPGRSADLRDVLADCVGGFSGALAAALLPATRAGGPTGKSEGPAVKSN